jgi:hypothetical protein
MERRYNRVIINMFEFQIPLLNLDLNHLMNLTSMTGKIIQRIITRKKASVYFIRNINEMKMHNITKSAGRAFLTTFEENTD